MKLKYNIDDKIKLINIDEKTDFSLGPSICLSKKFGDITRNQSWYKLGYKLVNTKKVFNFIKVKKNIQSLIFNMIYETNKNVNKNEFILEN